MASAINVLHVVIPKAAVSIDSLLPSGRSSAPTAPATSRRIPGIHQSLRSSCDNAICSPNASLQLTLLLNAARTTSRDTQQRQEKTTRIAPCASTAARLRRYAPGPKGPALPRRPRRRFRFRSSKRRSEWKGNNEWLTQIALIQSHTTPATPPP